MVAEGNNPRKDDLKDMKANRTSPKATEAKNTEKGKEGEVADELKSEKTTEADSKATGANMTEKVWV